MEAAEELTGQTIKEINKGFERMSKSQAGAFGAAIGFIFSGAGLLVNGKRPGQNRIEQLAVGAIEGMGAGVANAIVHNRLKNVASNLGKRASAAAAGAAFGLSCIYYEIKLAKGDITSVERRNNWFTGGFGKYLIQ
jgi:hypothetical protein